MKRSLIFLSLLIISLSCFAQKSKLKDLERQRKLALQEISNTDRLLKDTRINTSSLLNRIKLISNQIDARQRVLGLLEQEIYSIGEEEGKIGTEITVLEGELKNKRAAYAKAVESVIQNRQNDNKILFVLSGRSITESYRRLRYLKDYSDWRSKQAEDIKEKSKDLKIKQDSLHIAKLEKESLLKERETEQLKLKKEEDNYQYEVGQIKQKEKELQRILAQKKRQAEGLDKQIEKLISEEIKRQEERAKRQEEAAAKAKADKAAASTGTTKSPTTPAAKPAVEAPSSKPAVVSTKENVALSNNFASNKGKLPYPITGKYTITSRFGTNRQSKWVTTSNNGIDIQSQSSAEAKAVFGGEVTSIVSIPGYGNCILIRHGSYYTFYGNIKTIAVKKGEKVATGQTLGQIYTDPDTNISQIHFQLWQNKTKLNPEPWLR